MRLIDAEVLMKDIQKTITEQSGTIDWMNMIYRQPTAYDVEKVVEKLKTLKEDTLAEYNIGEYNLDNNIGNSIAENYRKDMNEGKCFAYDEAIEIVKQEAEQYEECYKDCGDCEAYNEEK